MARHRDQAKFDRSGWRLKVLLSCWMAQISLLLILIGTSAYLFSQAVNQSVEERGTAIAWESINIGISAVSILLTAYEILRTLTEALTPKTMLVSNLAKLVGVVLCMIMDGMVVGTSLTGWTDGTLAIHSLLLASILVLGCYAAWKWRRLAQYDDYHHPGNVRPFGFHSDLKLQQPPQHKAGGGGHARMLSDDMDWDADLELAGHADSTTGSPPPGAAAAAGIMAPTPGEHTPTTTTGGATAAGARARGVSATGPAGRLTLSLANAVGGADTAYDPAAAGRPASYVSVSGAGRASYNHTRDTAFDEYVRRQKDKAKRASAGSNSSAASAGGGGGSNSSTRDSPATTPPASHVPSDTSAAAAAAAAVYRLSLNLKNDVDDALGAVFGWGTAGRPTSQDGATADGHPPAIAVGGGAMQNVKSVRDSLGRAPSDSSERGALEGVPENAGDDEDDENDGERRRRRNVDEASRALLGGSREDDQERPELLAPARPKSEAIAFVITPPPKSPDTNPRLTWGHP